MVRDVVDVLQRAFLLTVCALVLLCFAVGAPACALQSAQGRTVQLDPDADDDLGGTGVESGDIRGASEQIARGIRALHRADVRIVVMPVQNLSRFRVDPLLLQNRLVQDLVERSRGTFHIVSLDGVPADSRGDMALYTQVRSLTKDNGPTTSDYVQYAFTLRRPGDGEVLWSGMFETKRKSDVDVIYQ